MAKAPDWLPDWRDERQYAFPGEGDWAHWTWEFLRRNPDYRRDWARYAAAIGPTREDHAFFVTNQWPYLETGLRRRDPLTPLDAFYCNPPAQPGETLSAYRARLKREGWPKDAPITMHRLDLALRSRYGVDTLADPAVARPKGFSLRVRPLGDGGRETGERESGEQGGQETGASGTEAADAPPPAGETAVAMTFDLDLPLDAQLKRAKRALDRVRRSLHAAARESRARHDDHRLYLRLLDAEATGAETVEIASVLFPDEGGGVAAGEVLAARIARELRAAKALRDGGYVTLASAGLSRPTAAADEAPPRGAKAS